MVNWIERRELTYKFIPNAQPILQAFRRYNDAINERQERHFVFYRRRLIQLRDDHFEAVPLGFEILWSKKWKVCKQSGSETWSFEFSAMNANTLLMFTL